MSCAVVWVGHNGNLSTTQQRVVSKPDNSVQDRGCRRFPFSGKTWKNSTSSSMRRAVSISEGAHVADLWLLSFSICRMILPENAVAHLKVARNGPSILTSLMPSGISRNHSFQLSRSTLSSSSRIDRCSCGLFSYDEKLLRIGLFSYIGERKMEGSLEFPDIIICNGDGKLVKISFSGNLSCTILE